MGHEHCVCRSVNYRDAITRSRAPVCGLFTGPREDSKMHAFSKVCEHRWEATYKSTHEPLFMHKNLQFACPQLQMSPLHSRPDSQSQKLLGWLQKRCEWHHFCQTIKELVTSTSRVQLPFHLYSLTCLGIASNISGTSYGQLSSRVPILESWKSWKKFLEPNTL